MTTTNTPTIEQDVSKILDECVKECNDGPTPWCFDSDIDHKYRNQIMDIISQAQSQAVEAERSRVVEIIDKMAARSMLYESQVVRIKKLLLEALKESNQ